MGIVVIILLLVCVGLIVFAGLIYRKNEELNHHVESLRKYEPIVDVEAEIASKKRELAIQIQDAQRQLEHKAADKQRALNAEEAQMRSRLTNINAEIDNLTKESKQTLSDARKERKLVLDEASHSAIKIIDNANDQAKQVGEDVLDAQKNHRIYTNGLAAMKRKVRGYGDEWLIPNHSALDELAEEYSYKEAGKQLKLARERTKQLVKLNRVADCQYAENVRRDTAVSFITDAFNGGVDSILSDIKHDNYGKMQKKIQDVYNLVNLNGSAFRNARILPEYLQARLDELDWGVKVLVLQLEEREEQRAIRARMQEENRRRIELEKIQKDAEKEEKMLEDAMAKARQHLEGAHAGERDKYEQELAELEVKWKEAEARSQRAQSQAQLTKCGHVYVISNIGSFGENVYKIGLTRRLKPLERVKELGDASVPFEFDVHTLLYSEDAPALEYRLHQEFHSAKVNKVNPRKEFFRLTLAEIRKLVDEMGMEAKWTMAAEAAQYRETKALEANPDLLERRLAGETVTVGWNDEED